MAVGDCHSAAAAENFKVGARSCHGRGPMRPVSRVKMGEIRGLSSCLMRVFTRNRNRIGDSKAKLYTPVLAE